MRTNIYLWLWKKYTVSSFTPPPSEPPPSGVFIYNAATSPRINHDCDFYTRNHNVHSCNSCKLIININMNNIQSVILACAFRSTNNTTKVCFGPKVTLISFGWALRILCIMSDLSTTKTHV